MLCLFHDNRAPANEFTNKLVVMWVEGGEESLKSLLGMDWKTVWKLIDFCENWRNQSIPASSVFWKPSGQIWNLIFLKKKSKKTRVHFKIFIKTELKTRNNASYKIRQSVKSWKKKTVRRKPFSFLKNCSPLHRFLWVFYCQFF
jgi:hypothetical protein